MCIVYALVFSGSWFVVSLARAAPVHRADSCPTHAAFDDSTTLLSSEQIFVCHAWSRRCAHDDTCQQPNDLEVCHGCAGICSIQSEQGERDDHRYSKSAESRCIQSFSRRVWNSQEKSRDSRASSLLCDSFPVAFLRLCREAQAPR